VVAVFGAPGRDTSKNQRATKDHKPDEDIIQRVRDTPYQGSISKFVNELKFSSSKVHNKLELQTMVHRIEWM